MKTYYLKLVGVVAVASVLFLQVGCVQQKPQLSPMQKRQITTKMVDGNYDNLFASTMTVLQDHEYVIKQTNKDTGLITAEVNKDAGFATKFFTTNKYGNVSNSGTKVEVSAVISKLSSTKNEIRLSIEEKTYNNSGGTTASKQLYQPEVFQTLFNDITTEVKRREAFGK